MTPGTVLFFKDFEFKDHGVSHKLLIVLNSPKIENSEPYLVCPTTSQQHKKSKAVGCHAEKNYFYVEEKQDKFWRILGLCSMTSMNFQVQRY